MPLLKRTERHLVVITLNGKQRRGYAAPRTLLTDFLRHELGATGTHSAVSTAYAEPARCGLTARPCALV